MRDAFHEELDAVAAQLVELTRLAGTSMTRATRALLEADLSLAEVVITDDQHIDALREDLDTRLLHLVARQQPVATDLRMVLTSLRMNDDLERMGDLARHIAKVARRRYPGTAIPNELRPAFGSMGEVAARLASKAGGVIRSRDLAQAMEVEQDDDEMDRLHATMLRTVLAGKLELSIEEAVDVTLCGRYYERFADHAVTVAKKVVFIVTGQDADYYVAEPAD